MQTLRSGLLRLRAVALALVAGIVPLAAQVPTGSIAGQITDSSSKAPLAGARVQLVGTQLVATTRGEGRFTIRSVPVGEYEVRVLAVGYSSARTKVTVTAGGIAEANVAMVPVAYSLDDLVFTATGEQRRLELGHTVGTIKADSIATYSPISDLSDLLQGRTAGVNILQSSGTTGTGTRIRIRGANSVSLSNEPLIFIDGVRANGGVASSSLGTGGQAPSRLNDINPEEIENIEIIKGPSAATLYGTEAANGVIRITTKRGTTGDTRWNFWVEQGRITDPNQYFDNYRAKGRAVTNGAPGGGVVTCLLVSRAAGTCVQDSVTTFNPLRTPGISPIGTGARRQYGASVTGGTNQVQYFVSGEYEGEDGTFELPAAEERRLQLARNVTELPESVLRPNALTKVSFRTNVNANVAANTDLQASLGYVSSDLRLPQNDNNVLGMLPSGFFGRASAADTAGTGGGWGFFRPGEIFSLLRNQNVERFTGSAQGTTRPASWLNARASVGYDITNRTDISFDPTQQGPAFGTTPLGSKTDTRVQLRTYTVDLGATASASLRSNLKSKTSVGVQYFRDVFFSNTANGQRLPFGSSDIDGAAILTASQTTTKTVTLGAYVEQQLNFGEKLFLTGAIRADDNSSFGTTPLGAKTDNRAQIRTYTVDLGATASASLRDNLKSKTSVGV
ncbi:MAG TPA: TonB-dependent receptor plug domain-containing protein, partial [Gemmatimonadales bacterium]|nr:TonB-dependent receptor plug domain-containing protein [Gemmatimonadales bacterium]